MSLCSSCLSCSSLDFLPSFSTGEASPHQAWASAVGGITRSPTADWKDTCFCTACLSTHCRGRSCPGDKRQQLHLWILQLHAPLLLSLRVQTASPSLTCQVPKGCPEETGSSLPGYPAHRLLGERTERRTTYRFVKPLGTGALHANISCQMFFNFCPQQL